LFRSRWILLTLFAVVAVAAIYVGTNPEMASRYAAAQRDAALSADSKETITLLIGLAIAAYLGWFFFIRRH
jgi:hypothetical protein